MDHHYIDCFLNMKQVIPVRNCCQELSACVTMEVKCQRRLPADGAVAAATVGAAAAVVLVLGDFNAYISSEL